MCRVINKTLYRADVTFVCTLFEYLINYSNNNNNNNSQPVRKQAATGVPCRYTSFLTSC